MKYLFSIQQTEMSFPLLNLSISIPIIYRLSKPSILYNYLYPSLPSFQRLHTIYLHPYHPWHRRYDWASWWPPCRCCWRAAGTAKQPLRAPNRRRCAWPVPRGRHGWRGWTNAMENAMKDGWPFEKKAIKTDTNPFCMGLPSNIVFLLLERFSRRCIFLHMLYPKTRDSSPRYILIGFRAPSSTRWSNRFRYALYRQGSCTTSRPPSSKRITGKPRGGKIIDRSATGSKTRKKQQHR